jgi:hypothetical protein
MAAAKNKWRARQSSRHDSQRAPGEEPAELDALIARKRGEQLAADQITAKDKEKIDPDPAEPVHSPRQFESEKRGVINDDHDDRERSEKIESGLAFAILKARIDFVVSLRSERRCSLSCELMNARK